jgi:hypothetical protein
MASEHRNDRKAEDWREQHCQSPDRPRVGFQTQRAQQASIDAEPDEGAFKNDAGNQLKGGVRL